MFSFSLISPTAILAKAFLTLLMGPVMLLDRTSAIATPNMIDTTASTIVIMVELLDLASEALSRRSASARLMSPSVTIDVSTALRAFDVEPPDIILVLKVVQLAAFARAISFSTSVRYVAQFFSKSARAIVSAANSLDALYAVTFSVTKLIEVLMVASVAPISSGATSSLYRSPRMAYSSPFISPN